MNANVLCGVAERPKRYMPFAEGLRSCVGKNLANATLPLTMAILLSHFSFKLADRVRQELQHLCLLCDSKP